MSDKPLDRFNDLTKLIDEDLPNFRPGDKENIEAVRAALVEGAELASALLEWRDAKVTADAINPYQIGERLKAERRVIASQDALSEIADRLAKKAGK